MVDAVSFNTKAFIPYVHVYRDEEIDREYRPRYSGRSFYTFSTVFMNTDDCINKALGAKLSYKSYRFFAIKVILCM